MRANTSTLFNNAAMISTVEIISPDIEISQKYGFCIQAVWTGTPTGTFAIQASAYASTGDIYYTSPTSDPSIPWTTIASTTYTTTGAPGSYLWNIDAAYYRYVRLIYTNASGTGTVSAAITFKGV